MELFYKISKKAAYFSTTFIMGLCLVMLIISLTANAFLLNPAFHKSLFKSDRIYENAEEGLKKSISTYLSNLDSKKGNDTEVRKEIFTILQKSITNESVKNNINSINVEFFQYLSGKRKFLPDIYINAQEGISSKAISDAYNADNIPLDSITGINKINLSTILQYMNRDDINDYILILKFFYYLIATAPSFLLLILLITGLVGLYSCKKLSESLKWFTLSLFQCSIYGTIGVIAMLTYTFSILPKNIYPVAMTLPLGNKVIINYIRDCITPFIAVLAILSVISIVFALLIKKVVLNINAINNPKVSLNNQGPSPEKTKFLKKQHLYGLVHFSLLIIIVMCTGYKMYVFKHTFDKNNFSFAIEKMRNANAVTQVIAAKDEAVYTLQVKVVDNDTQEPLPNISINVTGTGYNDTSVTDSSGIAKFNTGKGDFRLSYVASDFPKSFQMPTPYFFELKTAGTTIITSSLDKNNRISNPGIVEIEVIDKKGNPVSGLELTVAGDVFAIGNPDRVYSYTGTDGIASFKLGEGEHKVSFVQSKFPGKYDLPPIIDVDVKPDLVSRYTLSLLIKK